MLITKWPIVWMLAPLLAGIGSWVWMTGGAHAGQEGRDVHLVLLPALDSGRIAFVGTVGPAETVSLTDAVLHDWGFTDAIIVTNAHQGSRPLAWQIQGGLGSLGRYAVAESSHALHLGPFQLRSGDVLHLAIPNVQIQFDEITPTPDTISAIQTPHIQYLTYRANGATNPLEITIPIHFYRQDINLSLTPLLSRGIAVDQVIFRYSGQATIAAIEDRADLQRYCSTEPAQPFFRFGQAHLQFALDYPPEHDFFNLMAELPPATESLVLQSTLVSCSYLADKGGEATLNFSGTSRRLTGPGAGLAPAAQPVNVLTARADAVVLSLGEIHLFPGDRLRITTPESTLLSVEPLPTNLTGNADGLTEVVYLGPSVFTSTIVLQPQPSLLVRQFPNVLRSATIPIEEAFPTFMAFSTTRTGGFEIALRPLFAPTNAWPTWLLASLGAALLASSRSRKTPRPAWVAAVGWTALAMTAVWGFPNMVGGVALAVLLRTWLNRASNQPTGKRDLLLFLLVAAALLLERWTDGLFDVLIQIDRDLTPMTGPVLLLWLFSASYVLFAPKAGRFNWSSGTTHAVALTLIALCTYDSVNRSLPAAILFLGLCAAWIWRYRTWLRNHPGHADLDAPRRFRDLLKDQRARIGLVILAAFLFVESGGGQSLALFTLRSNLGVVAWILGPTMIAATALLNILATGALFIVTAPILPFRESYLKALSLAVMLLAIFLLGIGSDTHLVDTIDQLVVGRLIYLLCAPLLLAAILDLQSAKRKGRATSQASTAAQTMDSKASWLTRGETLLRLASAVATIVAPSAYASLMNQPLVTTYFQLIKVLVAP